MNTPSTAEQPSNAAPKKAIIYARTSGGADNEQDSMSIAGQLEICHKICRDNGYFVAGEFSDASCSGALWADVEAAKADVVTTQKKGNERRENFTKVIHALERGDAHVLVVWNTTRIARPISGTFAGWLGDFFSSRNILVHSKEKGLQDYNDFYTDLMAILEHKLGRKEIDANAGRAKEERLKRKRGGYSVATPPFGFNSVGRKKDRQMVVNACEYKTMLELYHLFLEKDFSLVALSKYLVSKNFKSKRKGKKGEGKPLNYTCIRQLLKCPYFCGYYWFEPEPFQAGQKQPYGEGKKWQKERRQQATLKLSPQYKTALDRYDGEKITFEMYNKVLNKLKLNTLKPKRARGLTYNFSGLLKCGACGMGLHCHVNKRTNKNAPPKTYLNYYCHELLCKGRASVSDQALTNLMTHLLEHRHRLQGVAATTETVTLEEIQERLTALEATIKAKKGDVETLEKAKEVVQSIIAEQLDKQIVVLKKEIEAREFQYQFIQSQTESLYPTNSVLKDKILWLCKSIIAFNDKVKIQTRMGREFCVSKKFRPGTQWYSYLPLSKAENKAIFQ